MTDTRKRTNLETLKEKCDSRVYDVFVDKAGKNAEVDAKMSLDLYKKKHCMLERAMADILDKYRK